MAWDSWPATLVNGEVADANDVLAALDELKEHVQALENSPRPTFSASITTPWEPDYNTWQTVRFNSKDWDDSGWYSTSTYRFTPQIPGVYRLSCVLETLDLVNDTNVLIAAAYKNGAPHRTLGRLLSPGDGHPLTANGTALVTANGTTDYFDIRVLINFTGSRRLGANSYFQGELVRVA